MNIGGITLHKWAGIGISEDFNQQKGKAWGNKNIWRQTDALVIDEISMIRF